ASGGEGCFNALPPARKRTYLDSARIMPLLMGKGEPPANITASDLAGIRIPVTVAHGAATRPLFSIASRAVAAAIPDATLTVLSDADHMLPEKDPIRFAGLLIDWLAEQSGLAGGTSR